MRINVCIVHILCMHVFFVCGRVYWHMGISWVTVSLILDFFLMHGLAILGQNEIIVTATSGVQGFGFQNPLNSWTEIIKFVKCYKHDIQLLAYKLFQW